VWLWLVNQASGIDDAEPNENAGDTNTVIRHEAIGTVVSEP
jgi:hypothetical protein